MRIHGVLTFLLLGLSAGSIHVDHAWGQNVPLDEGTFLLSMNDRRAGSESFSIRRSGAGDDAQVIATAQVRLEQADGTLELRPALQARGADMAVSAYQVKISGAREEEIYVTLGDRRFHTKVVSVRGEQEREYRAQAGTVLLDSGIAHQFYFLGPLLNAGETTVPAIVPRQGRQLQLRFAPEGREPLAIGGTTIDARRFRLEGGSERWTVWFDDRGRVLRVDDSSTGYRAVRQDPPR